MTKSVKSKKQDELIYPKKCPVCGVDTNYVYRIESGKTGEKSTWYKCQNGVVFQKDLPKHDIYNKEYLEHYVGIKENQTTHAARTYAPIIEELMYGRMMLDVGFGAPFNMKFFEDRGWLIWGIDRNEEIQPGGNIYKGNFMTYDFSPNIDKKRLKGIIGTDKVKRTFDLIWMSHVLEHLNDPIGALKKAYDLLSEAGVIYISTPDIDFINKTGISGWPHWKEREHYIMWSERALVRELERLGFKTILKRRNFSSRFVSWWDVQYIGQKNYF